VRRGVAADAQTGDAQQRSQRRDDAPLAVGAADVEGSEALVRVTQLAQECARRVETELPGAGRAREEIVERRLIRAQGEAQPDVAG
jgi:hypothetical protein